MITRDTSGLAAIGALVGDPGRATMLSALLDGRALTAGELAGHAGVAAPTASAHLAKLVEAGLVVMRRQGRHRYHALASPEVAAMLESMSRTASTRPEPPGARALRIGPRDAALRTARTCYDHLAGRLAVDVADALTRRGLVEIGGDGGVVTPAGETFLAEFGLDLPALTHSGRAFCRTCLDWSERRIHLAGALGAALLARSVALRWLKKTEGTRALVVTAGGIEGFRKVFEVDVTRM